MSALITKFRDTVDNAIHQRVLPTHKKFVQFINHSIQQSVSQFTILVTIGSPEIIQSSSLHLQSQLEALANTYCQHYKTRNITLITKIKPIMANDCNLRK